jgi:hypothetical protein
MKVHVSLLACALAVSGSALAQNDRSLTEVLTADQGLARVGEGLYAQVDEHGESYVAVSAAGQQALLARLLELRAQSAQKGAAANRPDAPLERLIQQLSQPLAKGSMERYGDCNGPNPGGPLHAGASSYGGRTAGASASNSNAAVNTTNTAYAQTTDRSGLTNEETSTTYGSTPASASASAPGTRNLCYASASASVTCPGATRPAIAAFATSYPQQPELCL